jgi:hypothetical protein
MSKVTLRLEFDRIVQNECFKIFWLSKKKPKFIVELHGINRRIVVAALFNAFGGKLVPRKDCEGQIYARSNKKAFKVVGVEIKVQRDIAERLCYLFQKMNNLHNPLKDDEELAKLFKNPSVEKAERFIGLRKLMEDSPNSTSRW